MILSLNKNLLFLTILILLFCNSFLASAASSSDVIKLSNSNFDKEVINSDAVWIVGFFADWCGHCKRFKPQYKKAAEALGGVVKFGEVNGDEERELMSRYQVQGFPTVKIFPAMKENKKKGVEDYQGPRNARGVVDRVVNELPSNTVKRLTKSNLDQFLKNNDQPRAIFFTDKTKTPNLLKGLSLEFYRSTQIAMATDKDEAVVKHFHVDSFPSVIVIDTQGETHQYDGAMKYKDLAQFLSKFVSSSTPGSQSSSSNKKEQDPSKTRNTSGHDTFSGKYVLREMTRDATLANTCGKKICVIGFVDSDEHRSVLESLAKRYMKDKAIRVVHANLEKNHDAAQALGVKEMPTLVVHKVKGNKVAYLEGELQQENASALVDRALGGDLRFQRLETSSEENKQHDEL
eukprot:gb/GECH01011989.1/.p1 GENE.gb/GECH01011989.1/~~gb/GECH01011989.1/.p1  ORF type:complete len:403 (+),score=112.30 gb/GECH01011989.1/:1-1209(+)